MWLACSACCSTTVTPGQHTDTRKKGSTRSIFAAYGYDPSSVSLGMTVYQILQLWRELVLPIYSPSWEYIDYAGVAEWKDGRLPKDRMEDGTAEMEVQNGRWSASEGHLVWATTLCSPTCRSPQTPLQGRTKKRFKGTQHKYGKLGTIDTGACSLAPPSTRQTSIFDPNVHHRLQSSPNW